MGKKYDKSEEILAVNQEGISLQNSPNNSSIGVNEENQARLAENLSSFYATAVRSLKEKSIMLMDFAWRLPKSIYLYIRTTRPFELGFASNGFLRATRVKEIKTINATGNGRITSWYAKSLSSAYISTALSYKFVSPMWQSVVCMEIMGS